jgi:hypothetical protein
MPLAINVDQSLAKEDVVNFEQADAFGGPSLSPNQWRGSWHKLVEVLLPDVARPQGWR